MGLFYLIKHVNVPPCVLPPWFCPRHWIPISVLCSDIHSFCDLEEAGCLDNCQLFACGWYIYSHSASIPCSWYVSMNNQQEHQGRCSPGDLLFDIRLQRTVCNMFFMCVLFLVCFNHFRRGNMLQCGKLVEWRRSETCG